VSRKRRLIVITLIEILMVVEAGVVFWLVRKWR